MGRIWIFQGTVPGWRGDRAHGPAVCGLIPLAEERGKVRLFRKHLSRSDSCMKWTAMLLASTRALPALYQDSLIRTREPSRAFRST